jgi:tetratricopeptide (TPR) repeat protein
LVLVVPVVLLVTAGSRLVAVQEQALALREAVVGSLAGDDALAQAVWEQVCHTGLAQQSELSCLRLFLGTEGEQGLAPEIELDPKLLATYAYGFGRHLEEAQAVSSAIFSYQLSLEIAPNQQTADRLTQLLVRENREGEAIVVWDRIAAASPVEDPGHWWALGQAEELQQDWELAADAYGQGARSSEEPDKFWLGRGAGEASILESAAVRSSSSCSV